MMSTIFYIFFFSLFCHFVWNFSNEELVDLLVGPIVSLECSHTIIISYFLLFFDSDLTCINTFELVNIGDVFAAVKLKLNFYDLWQDFLDWQVGWLICHPETPRLLLVISNG